jgi:hypothetical protein
MLRQLNFRNQAATLSSTLGRGVVLFLLFTTQCSLNGIPLGTGGGNGSSNDPRPEGTLIAQGQLGGLSGRAVTGTALIFLAGGSSYILRLEGLSGPAENNLQIQVYGSFSPSPVFISTLSSTSGNQNYSFATGPGNQFNTVSIYSTLSRTNYATAVLTQLFHGSFHVIIQPPV